MFSYYGAKTNIVNYYPPPKYGKIIEPFAGSARYALRYFDREILLVDKYDVIIKIWKYLQQCSESDILSLPKNIKHGTKLKELKWDCEEQRLLMGFIVSCGAEAPRNLVGYRKTTDRPNHINYTINRIASNLFKIRHWVIIHGDYKEIKNELATWFIDPPYQVGGAAYIENEINYDEIGTWCRSREGQIIVCENTKATWMDFTPIKKHRGTSKTTTEAVWLNLNSSLNVKSQTIF